MTQDQRDTVPLAEVLGDKSITLTEQRRLRVAQRMTARLCGGIADKALTWLETEIDRDGPRAYDAAKLALEYTLGKPKQQIDVSSKVEHAHTLHLEVLKDLTLRQVHKGRIDPDSLPSSAGAVIEHAAQNDSPSEIVDTEADSLTATPAGDDGQLDNG